MAGAAHKFYVSVGLELEAECCQGSQPRTGAVEMPPIYFLIKYTMHFVISAHAYIYELCI